MILRFLVPKNYSMYDLTRPPGTTNMGSGIGVKYARVEEAASQLHDAKRIFDVADADGADIVFADWLWFCVGSVDVNHQIDSFLRLPQPKVIYGSELCALGWGRNLLNGLVNNVQLITHCCDYQRRMYGVMGIYHSTYLCDPVPPVFRPDPVKVPRLVFMGQISAAKRSHLVIEILQGLKGTGIETAYIGNVRMWGSQHHNKANNSFQQQISRLADLYVPRASQAETAQVVNGSNCFGHVAHHDTACESQQENGSAANITFGLTHPLMWERTKYRFETVDALVDAVVAYPFGEEQHELDMVETLEIADGWSYGSFHGQLHTILETLL